MLYKVTQELCDEAALYIALTYEVEIVIKKTTEGIFLQSENLSPLIVNSIMEYFAHHFLDEEDIELLRIARTCWMQGTIRGLVGQFMKYKDN